MFCLYPDFMMIGVNTIGHGLAIGFGGLWSAICAIASCLWEGIGYIGTYGWIALKWIGYGLLYLLYFVVGMAIFGAIFGGIGWVLIKIADNIHIAEAEKIDKEKKVTAGDWKSLLEYVFIYSTDNWITGLFPNLPDENQIYRYNSDEECGKKYAGVMRDSVVKSIRFFINNRVTIPDTLLQMPYSKFEGFRGSVYSPSWRKSIGKMTVVEELLKTMDAKYTEAWKSMKDNQLFAGYGFNNQVRDVFDAEFRRDYDKETDRVNKEIEENIEARRKVFLAKAQKKTKRNEYCVKITGFLNAVYEGIGKILSLIFVQGLWKGFILRIWRGVCFFFRQIKIFFFYMGITLWELKKGACPYLMFVDEMPKPEPVKEEKKA